MQTARARATATDNRMLTALSNERDGHRRHAGTGNLHGSPRPRGHMMVAGFVALLGAFVTTAGAGSGNGFVSAIGVAIAISAGVYAVFTVAQRRLASMVPGTAHIVSATAPPAAATHGRCEMHLVVQAPRLMATAVRHRDGSVPVAKWPTPGGTLPVVVDPRDPRDLRIRWDKVRPHGETAPDYDPKHEAQAEHRPTASPQPKLIPDDDLEILADATGVSSSTTGSVTTPGDVLVGSDRAGGRHRLAAERVLRRLRRRTRGPELPRPAEVRLTRRAGSAPDRVRVPDPRSRRNPDRVRPQAVAGVLPGRARVLRDRERPGHGAAGGAYRAAGAAAARRRRGQTAPPDAPHARRSEEHTSELQS